MELVRYAAALVGPSEAEDVVMTAAGRAIRRVSLSQLENPRGYLMKGVLNEARGRGRRRRPLRLDHQDVAIEMDQGMAEILDVLLTLPIRQRAAVYLYYWDRAPISDIAETMGIGAGTVKRYLHLARNKLKGVL
jgi:RNA polymerase sigma-70 factor (ECF subfamily)